MPEEKKKKRRPHGEGHCWSEQEHAEHLSGERQQWGYLAKALKPFVKLADEADVLGYSNLTTSLRWINTKHLRAARAAYRRFQKETSK